MKNIFFIIGLLFFLWQDGCAGEKKISSVMSVDLQSVSVQSALQMIAKQLNHNIVVSSFISGNMSLHLHHMAAEQILNFILNSEGLTKFQENGIWFIVPRNELIRAKQEEWKQQEIVSATAPLLTQIWQIHYAKASDVARMIQDAGHSLLSKRGYVQVDLRTNQIFIRDLSENMAVIAKVIQHMDVPVKQVLIEARLASIDADFERQLGIHFSVQDAMQNDVSPGHYALAVAKLADGSLLDMQLAALENDGHGELISSPSLFTGNQQTASIESGEEIPYQEISRSGATGVAFKKAVLSLKVTPQILPDNRIQLELQINQDRPSARMVLGVPAITTRQLNSHIQAISGQTIVLGGIFESNKEDSRQRIPFIGKIPVVGWLFQQQNKIENKRELLIFITPKVIE